MARKKSGNVSTRFDNGQPKGGTLPDRRNPLTWISPYLNQSDLDELESQSDDVPNYICSFLSQLPEGYTVSTKFDDKSGRWLASCICNDSADPNCHIAVTQRAATRLDSVFALAYVCAVKLEWEWSRDVGDPNSRFG